MIETPDKLRPTRSEVQSISSCSVGCVGKRTLVVTNAPAGTSAAERLLAHVRACAPCGVLLLGGAPAPGSIEVFRADARATGHNLKVLRAATRWLRDGGALVILRGPEGSAPLRSRVAEARWGELVRRLATWSGAAVVPAYVTAVPGSQLQRLGRRLLPSSLTQVREAGAVCIGDALPVRKLRSFEAAFEVSRFLHLRIGLLSACAHGRGRGKAHVEREQRPISPGPSADTLEREISGLDGAAHLLDSGEMSVYCACASELPDVLREIGRLREVTFRAVGEGTGGDVDLDVYDEFYLHLFIWHRGNREIVGGYRLGLADEILARFGKRGLYSHSLFRYRTRLIEHIGPAIEMGRSFVQPAYQREFTSLMLLWKGICRFVSRNPRYRVLFGPVSISADYATLSQQLLVDFLTFNRGDGDLAREVRPRRRFRGQLPAPWRRAGYAGLDNIEDVSELIAQIEPDAKGMPVLLRQYLKLGGRILGFNVDDQFSNVLDGLIMVDLLEADERTAVKYFGRERYEVYRAWHAEHGDGVAA